MIRPITLLAILLSLLVGCASQPKPAAGLASLRVHVVAQPKTGARVASQVSVYDTPSSTPAGSTFELVDYDALDDIVIYLEPAGPAVPGAPSAAATLDVGTVPPPSALAKPVSVGQTVMIHNGSDRPQNIYSVSDGNDFDLGNIAPGSQGQFIVQSAGLIEVLSSSSKDPVARMFAAPTRWVAMARSGGNVDFNNVPPGTYRLVSWHPRLPGSEQSITLSADQIAGATITVSVNSLPKIGGR